MVFVIEETTTTTNCIITIVAGTNLAFLLFVVEEVIIAFIKLPKQHFAITTNSFVGVVVIGFVTNFDFPFL